jgi:uncharacterized delta-60 repeat protein
MKHGPVPHVVSLWSALARRRGDGFGRSARVARFALLAFALADVRGQSVDPTFNAGTDSYVYALGAQPRGGALVGGAFKELAGEPCAFLGRINAEGVLDRSFRPNLNGVVRCLAIQPDGKILIGGQFQAAGGRTMNRIARLNREGSLDASFDAGLGVNSATSPSCEVTCLVVQPDGRILLGGSFDRVGRQTRNGIARLNADGSLDATFNPDAGGLLTPGATPGVFCLALQPDGKIVFGGQFTHVGDERRNGIARVNADGSIDKSFNPSQTPAQFLTLAVLDDGKIIAGGGFRKLAGFDQPHLARLMPDGSADPSLMVDVSGAVGKLLVRPDGGMLISGHFIFVDRQAHVGLAQLTPDGLGKHSTQLDLATAPGILGVNAFLPQADGSVLVGGRFSAIAGEAHLNLARITFAR